VLTDLGLALHMADRADTITTEHFAAPITVETKPDGTPVTAADREVEEALRALVRQHRPADGFLGEEFGSTGGHIRRWIVDAIDGTHNFADHRPQWGTLIGLEENGALVVGVASAPAVDRRWWASRGGGAWTAPLGDKSTPIALRVSQVESLTDARIEVLPPTEVAGIRAGWRGRVADRIESATHRSAASPVSGHWPLLLAEGRLDASVHLWGGPWDHAALVAIVEEAGGSFHDLWGGHRLDTQTAVYSNALLGDALLALVHGLVGPPPR